jgi:tetrahydromethanopterin S-methyltransferase subunit C
MNFEVFKTILRQVLIALGTYLTTVGVVDQSLIEPIVGGLLAIAAAVWGILAKKKDQDTIKHVQ